MAGDHSAELAAISMPFLFMCAELGLGLWPSANGSPTELCPSPSSGFFSTSCKESVLYLPPRPALSEARCKARGALKSQVKVGSIYFVTAYTGLRQGGQTQTWIETDYSAWGLCIGRTVLLQDTM